jgi:hypothetical protein
VGLEITLLETVDLDLKLEGGDNAVAASPVFGVLDAKDTLKNANGSVGALPSANFSNRGSSYSYLYFSFLGGRGGLTSSFS